MAKFMLALYDDPSTWRNLSAEEMQKALEKYMAWGSTARSSGILVGSDKLTNDTGRVLRSRDGQVRVTDGPYSETKEVLGGYYIIEAASYEQAVERTRDHPHLSYGGTIELRQIEQFT